MGQNPKPLKSLVAATLEKAITYVFGREYDSQCGGQGFDPLLLHQ